MNARRCSTLFTRGCVPVQLGLRRGLLILFPVILMFLPRTSGAAANPSAIPPDQIGVTVEKQYSGDGLSVCATNGGARLRCVFQKMEGEVTREGLWLTSTAEESKGERFRVMATAVGRGVVTVGKSRCDVPARAAAGGTVAPLDAARTAQRAVPTTPLPSLGSVEVADHVARFIRPALTEEYRVSMDGVQQDFLIAQRPGGEGELRIDLDLSGANAEPIANGARLVLENSGRRIDYSRLRVTDANGKELPARMVVEPDSDVAATQQSAAVFEREDGGALPSRRYARLAVLVDDTEAVYPVRIDPTFSDANWISMNPSIPGADSRVSAVVVDGSGNLYIGGSFTLVGDVLANYIAKWNGSSWAALGLGMNNIVTALAVSGSDLYAGGYFTTAGGNAAYFIAKWNGSSWTNLDSGMNSYVYALAVSGNELYAGGYFTMAGSSAANRIAKWNGNSWTALGSGMNNTVQALAVAGADVYAGGKFTTAGGSAANGIAKWDGSSWSALGSGMGGAFPYVYALAVLGSDLYAGGTFETAGTARPITLPNGTGAVGRRSVRG